MNFQRIRGVSIHTRINAKKYLAQPNASSRATNWSNVLRIAIVHPLHEIDVVMSRLGHYLPKERSFRNASVKQDWAWYYNSI